MKITMKADEPVETCKSICENVQCELPLGHNLNHGRRKHRNGGAQWTDAGLERVRKEKEEEEPKTEIDSKTDQ